MTWFKVDDTLHSHKKAMRAGTEAMGLWVLAGSWAADQLTDGFVPGYALTRWGSNADELAERLVRAGLWTPGEHDGDTGWWFHQWDELQPSREDVLARRKADADRRAKWRAARQAKRDAGPDGGGDPPRDGGREPGRDTDEGSQGASRRDADRESQGASALPDPTRPDPARPGPPLRGGGWVGGDGRDAERPPPPPEPGSPEAAAAARRGMALFRSLHAVKHPAPGDAARAEQDLLAELGAVQDVDERSSTSDPPAPPDDPADRSQPSDQRSDVA